MLQETTNANRCMFWETTNSRRCIKGCSIKLYIILWFVQEEWLSGFFFFFFLVNEFKTLWHISIKSRLMKVIVYFLHFTRRWLYPSLHSHWIIYKSNAIQSQKVRLVSLNFICPQSRSLHLNWLSGLLYDCGDNGESGDVSREWFICSISDICPRRRWIMPWEQLFLLGYKES